MLTGEVRRRIRGSFAGARAFRPKLEEFLAAAPDGRRDTVTLFRTSNSSDNKFRFRPGGLDFSRTYRVAFASGQTVELSGNRLLQ